jgi:hypothetical protein
MHGAKCVKVASRTWGFRLSLLDVLVLAAAIPATWPLWPRIGSMAGVIPLAVVHFFLFCNVFRIHRTKELVWAAICVVNVSTWAALDAFCWFGILAVQLPVTVAVIVLEMRGPWYHGVMARRINARLDDYLMGRL